MTGFLSYFWSSGSGTDGIKDYMVEQATRITDIQDILTIVRKRKWLIILPWLFVALAAWGGSYLLTPQYKSFAIVSVDPNVRLSGDLQKLLGLDQRYRQTQAQQSAMLKSLYNEITSTRYVDLTNDRLHLDDNEELRESARRIAARQQAAGTLMSEEQVRLLILQDQLKEQIKVSMAGEDQIEITAMSTSQGRARDMANVLADVFIEERLKQELSSLRSSQDFSDVQLQKYEKQLAVLIDEKTQFEREFLNVQLDVNTTSESNRNELRAEIVENNNDIDKFYEAEKKALSKLGSRSGVNIARLTLSQTDESREIKNQLTRETSNSANLMVTHSWDDPQMVNMRLKMNSLNKNLEIEQRRMINDQFASLDDTTRQLLTDLFAARSNLDFCYANKTNLESALNALDNKVNTIPEYQAQLDRLNREVAAATEIRDKFKDQQESSNISQALLQDVSTSKYRKVEPAKLALAPFSPNRLKIVLMGFMLGLVIGAAAAILSELFDKSFKRVEDVQDFLGLPVLGVMPKMEILRRIIR
ncbi:MAG: Wzz/FepE/Etk N-terminal domain-containing protein [candidate division Zixibacteria bacterium]|nr:Wzz/FepE/Etk N-terminal domain-containing protein [candidate division Zixibacteria bacterium]